MTYASETLSVSGRNSAPESIRALPVFRTPKRNVRSVSWKRASNPANHIVKTHTETLGRQALEEMFVASRSKFVAIASSILRNREDAEDAVQNALLSAYRHLRSFEGRSALRTWLTGIVINAAFMIQRKRKLSAVKLVSGNGDSYEVNWMENIPAPQPDPGMLHAERETFECIKGILGKMKPMLRQTFAMTCFDELSGSEATALLGVSSGTFKARLARARRQVSNKTERALVAPIHKTTFRRLNSRNVDDSAVCEILNP